MAYLSEMEIYMWGNCWDHVDLIPMHILWAKSHSRYNAVLYAVCYSQKGSDGMRGQEADLI